MVKQWNFTHWHDGKREANTNLDLQMSCRSWCSWPRSRSRSAGWWGWRPGRRRCPRPAARGDCSGTRHYRAGSSAAAAASSDGSADSADSLWAGSPSRCWRKSSWVCARPLPRRRPLRARSTAWSYTCRATRRPTCPGCSYSSSSAAWWASDGIPVTGTGWCWGPRWWWLGTGRCHSWPGCYWTCPCQCSRCNENIDMTFNKHTESALRPSAIIAFVPMPRPPIGQLAAFKLSGQHQL